MKNTPIFPIKKTAPDTSRRATSRLTRHRIKFHLPRRAQFALLNLPEMKREIETNRRILIVELANELIASGFSQNRAARLLHLPASALSTMRAKYQKHGSDGLRAQKMGRAPRKRGPQPCTLNFMLRP